MFGLIQYSANFLTTLIPFSLRSPPLSLLQVKYAKDVLGEDTMTEVLVQCLGVTSLLGRLGFGLIADRAWVNRIYLQQVTMQQN